MSLKQLVERHTIYRHPLTQTQDAMLGNVEAIGAREKMLKGRMVPGTSAGLQLTRMIGKEWGQEDLQEKYLALFSVNPSLDETKALVWSSKVWRVRGVVNSSELGWIWIAVVEHIPQVELAVP